MESVDQIADGFTLQVHVPKKRVFVSAANVKNKASEKQRESAGDVMVTTCWVRMCWVMVGDRHGM